LHSHLHFTLLLSYLLSYSFQPPTSFILHCHPCTQPRTTSSFSTSNHDATHTPYLLLHSIRPALSFLFFIFISFHLLSRNLPPLARSLDFIKLRVDTARTAARHALRLFSRSVSVRPGRLDSWNIRATSISSSISFLYPSLSSKLPTRRLSTTVLHWITSGLNRT
jgi:hypothetical protein